MKETVIRKWEWELNTTPVELGLIIVGLSSDYYRENLNDLFAEAVEEFCRRHHYSERTKNEMIDSMDIHDSFYKMMEHEGFLPFDYARRLPLELLRIRLDILQANF